MQFLFLLNIVVCSSIVFLSSGCVPAAVIGVGALATTTLVEERGVSGTISDSAIRSGINTTWLKHRPKLLRHVELSVREGRVLLAGQVETAEDAVEAIRLAWTVSGVAEVIDRMRVGKTDDTIGGYLSDSWITTKIKTSYLTDSDIYSVNYTLKTVDDVVYIMGIAQSQKELDKVVQIARETRGVKKVVTYVRVKDQDPKIQKSGAVKHIEPDSGDEPSPRDVSEAGRNESDSDLDPINLGPVTDKPTVKP